MNRLIKKVAEEKETKLSEIVKNLDKSIQDEMINDVVRYAKTWLDGEVEDKDIEHLDSFDLSAEFNEEMLDHPDKILEAVLNSFPENVDDVTIYNSSHEDKAEAVEWILTFANAALSKVFDDTINETIDNYEDQDPNENNQPYGPGMNQKDFI